MDMKELFFTSTTNGTSLLSKLVGITLYTITKIEFGATFDPIIETVKK